MAKYSVVHACGHSSPDPIILYGKMTERERTLAWHATQPCTDCRRARVTADAIRHEADEGLPTLVGTEKETRWATDLRYRSFRMVDRLVARHAIDRDAPIPVPPSMAFAPGEAYSVDQLVTLLGEQNNARWWITHGGRVSRVRERPMMLNDEITDEEFVRDLFRAAVGLRPTATLSAKVDQLNDGILPAGAIGNAAPIHVADDPNAPVRVPLTVHDEE